MTQPLEMARIVIRVVQSKHSTQNDFSLQHEAKAVQNQAPCKMPLQRSMDGKQQSGTAWQGLHAHPG